MIKLDDVNMRITVELGMIDLPVKDVQELGDGSILKLDRLAGEPLIIKCNGVPIGLGETVTIEDNLGIRIMDIFDEKQRKEYWKNREIIPYSSVVKN